MTEGSTVRCFVCGARGFERTRRQLSYPGRDLARAFDFACTSCGVLVDDPEAGPTCARHLEAALSGPRFEPDAAAPYGLDLYTLRTAATRRSRIAAPAGAEQVEALRRPHADRAAEAILSDFEDVARPPVTLAILCREAEAADAVRSAGRHADWADDIVVLADAAGEREGMEGPVRLARRPLQGDFGAQRNAAQDLARHPWVLQLDADETIDAAFARSLSALVLMAGAGVVSIGFPRRNHVDGVLSDLFPDVQYRLNRREVRYAGRVHERPVRNWQQSFIALCGTIDHHLRRAHVEARSHRYEAMEPGGGRLGEADALPRPYRP